MDPIEEFGRRLRDQRKLKRLTIRQLAARSAMHWTYLGQIERGMRNPSLLMIVRLSKALGIDPGELLRGMSAATAPAEAGAVEDAG